MMAFVASIALGIAAQATGAVEPRQVTDRIARAIEEHYFDPAAGARAASAIREEAARGAFDRMAAQQLANSLTARLERYDRHFAVSYAPPSEAGQEAGGAAPSAYGPEEMDRRSGYGFRDVGVLPGNVGYIDLRTFAPIDFADANWPARRAADGALMLMARTDALIVDLRHNNGGDPSMVGYLVSAFVEPGRDVYNVFHARAGQRSERPETPWAGPRLAMPVYILISARTGSAAEAFAYTLQAAGRATVIGETSAGAANPGGSVPVGDGWQVFVAAATPINPVTGRNWEGTGVAPDVAIPAAGALVSARIAALEAVLPGLPAAERPDAELTLEALRAGARPGQASDLDAFAGTFEDLSVMQEGGQLSVRTGRRLPAALGRLSQDLFYSVDAPSTRYEFRRDSAGQVTSVEVRWIDGTRAEYRRGAAG